MTKNCQAPVIVPIVQDVRQVDLDERGASVFNASPSFVNENRNGSPSVRSPRLALVLINLYKDGA
jgi:hypothetical protein